MSRKTESANAAKILRKILEYGPMVPGTTPKERRVSLELAISLLEARMHDADTEGD